MANFENRVFLASISDIRQWGVRSATVLNTLEKTDVIFLLQGQEEIRPSQKKLIQDMKRKADLKLVELGKDDMVPTGKRILLEYLKKEGTKKKVYIIGQSLECMAEDCEDIHEKCESLTFHNNFQVKQIRKKESPEEDPQYSLLDMIGAVIEEQASQHKEQPKHKDSSMKGSPQSQERKSIPGPKPEREKREAPMSKNNVERQVFGGNVRKKEYKEYHTQLEDAKALLMLELQNRLHQHIREELFSTRETIVLSMSQLLNFTILILKSKTAEEFNSSWSVIERNPEMELKEGMFQRIKEEAVYYEKVSVLLYEEDLWS